MPKPIHEPIFIANKLSWDVHVDGPHTTFWASATTFKYALGLRPRAREDEKTAERLAKKNWAILELIGRDALATGAVKTDASKGWQVHHTIDDATFTRLFEKYEDQLVR